MARARVCTQLAQTKVTCNPGQAMRKHRAEPGPTARAAWWVLGLAMLARDDSHILIGNPTELDKANSVRTLAAYTF